jgi:hypothetical protein
MTLTPISDHGLACVREFTQQTPVMPMKQGSPLLCFIPLSNAHEPNKKCFVGYGALERGMKQNGVLPFLMGIMGVCRELTHTHIP